MSSGKYNILFMSFIFVNGSVPFFIICSFIYLYSYIVGFPFVGINIAGLFIIYSVIGQQLLLSCNNKYLFRGIYIYSICSINIFCILLEQSSNDFLASAKKP